MKKALFLLLLVAALPTVAQIQLTSVFDFSKPTELNPSVTPMTYEGGKVGVFGTTFVEGGVSMATSSAVNRQGGAQIITNTVNGLSYYLRLTSGTLITFTVTGGATINSITLSDDSSLGDLSNRSTASGVLSDHTWTATSSNVSSVVFFTDGGSLWKKVTVSYTTPRNVLTPTITLASTVESFRSVNLYFSGNMTQVSSSGICLTGTGIDGSKAFNTQVSGNVVTLSLPGDDVINTDGDFVIHVPAGSFQDSDGYANSEISYSFSVYEPRNTLKVTSIDPESGVKETLPDVVKVEFDKPVKLPTGTALDLYLDGEYEATLENISVSADNPNQIEIKTISSKKYGTFVIKVPAETIHTTAYGTNSAAANDRWNQEFEISYTIQKPEKVIKLEGLITDVTALKTQIAANGIGYPTSESAAATGINTALDNTKEGTTLTIDEQIAGLEAAIVAYYAETTVVMPAPNNWYSIKGMNKGKTKEVYLGYVDGKITVVTDKNSAAAFFLTESEGKYLFKTADDKYLTMQPGVNYVSDVQDLAKLEVQKLLVAGVENEELLGMFYLKGNQGFDATNGTPLGDAYETIDYEANAIANNAETQFTAALSSAFTFFVTKDPTYVEPVEPVAALSVESLLTTAKSIILTFTNIPKVDLADGTKVYFSSDAPGVNKITTSIAANILTKSDTEENSFIVHLDGLNDAGTYYLQMPLGTFDYSNSGKPVTDIRLYKEFTLTEPASEFNPSYTIWVDMQTIERNSQAIDIIHDVDLNNLVIMAEVPKHYTDLVPNPNVIVEIINAYNMDNVVGRGHFEAYSTFATDYPQYANDGYKAIKLVMDSPIHAGDLKNSPDTYSYNIPEGAWGDANYKKYLDQVSGIKKEDCIVNPQLYAPSFLVDNDRATGINNITVDDAASKVIYDLQGRRVTDTSKKGIYIINGRKVVIK